MEVITKMSTALHHFLKYEDRCLDETVQVVICMWFALLMFDGVLLLTCPPASTLTHYHLLPAYAEEIY